ncbi:MAG: hypothetical protein IKZ28_01135, partial [Clostridia bacterium]|nr:hypothetical protein [Clostridia bacterium]
MKVKRLIPLLALTLCVSAFGGCTNTDEKIPFGNYWNTASLTNEAINETLVYDVRFDATPSSLTNYQISYSNGKYTTNLVSATENGQNLYVYTTALTIDVTYSLGGETKTLSDSVTTESRFMTAENALRPISSKKSVVSSSPKNGSAESVDKCYTVYDYEVVTTYAADCASGTSTVTNNGSENKDANTYNFEIEQKKFSYLDNEQLPLALRAIPLEKTAPKFLTYSPFVDTVQKISCAFGTEES